MKFLLLFCGKPLAASVAWIGAMGGIGPGAAPMPPPPPAGAGVEVQAAPREEIPVAKPVPHRHGFCFNPWTNEMVDVRGIPAGFLVRDPKDPHPNRKFRVPEFPAPQGR